jgi:hypothetical protein
VTCFCVNLLCLPYFAARVISYRGMGSLQGLLIDLQHAIDQYSHAAEVLRAA